MSEATPGVALRRGRAPRQRRRVPVTFYLDERLVDRAREEVGEAELVCSIEAALVAAVDYRCWMREVAAGRRRVRD
jgi:hypothetical protein